MLTNRGFAFYLLGLVAFVVYFAGCAAAPYKESYDAAIKANRYEEAYKILKAVCTSVPSEPPCATEYKRVSEIYAGERLTKLNTDIKNSARPIPLKDIDGFQADAKEIKSINPNAYTVNVLSLLETERKDTKAIAEKSVKDGAGLTANGEFRKANDLYKLAFNLDQSYKEDYEKNTKTGMTALLDEAASAKANEDWRKAASAFEDAAHIDPSNAEAAKGVEEAGEKNNLAYYMKAGDDASAAEKYDDALAYYVYAAGYPDSDSANAKISATRVNAASKYFTEGEELIESGSPLSASISFTKAASFYNNIPRNGRSAVKVPSAKITRILNDMFSKAKASADEKDYTQAYFYATMISRIQPDYPDLAAFRDKVREEVKRRALTTIAVIPFKGPSTNPGAGNSMTSRIMDFLYKEMSNDVKILERGAMESLLKEGEVKALQGGEVTESIMKILPADYFLFGDISHYNIDAATTESTKTRRGKTGTTKVKNREYEEWLVKKKGDAPPMFVDEPVYENVKYKVTHHKKSAFISVGYRIVNANGDVVNTGVIEKKKLMEDDSSEGVDIGEFVVEAKMAVIPSDSELMMTVENEAMGKLGDDLKVMFGDRDKALIAESEKFKEKGNYKAAIDRLVKAYFVAQKKGLDTKSIEDATLKIILDGKL